MKEIKENSRLSNFELLRIISIYGIVTMHIMSPFLVTSSGITKVLVLAVNSIANCGISIFELISGYFGIKKDIRKALRLWNIAVFYLFFYVGVHIIVEHTISLKSIILCLFPISYGGNWYIASYILIIFFADIINSIPELLKKNVYQFVLIIGFFWLYIVPTIIQSSFTRDGGKGIINFVYMYLVGRYIRKYGEKINTRHVSKLLCASIFIIFLLNSALSFLITDGYSIHLPFAHDNSVFIVLGSICLFFLFKEKRFYVKTINLVSRHVIGVFMSNTAIIYLIASYFDLRKFENNYYCWILIFAGLLVMLVCILIDFLRFFASKLIEEHMISLQIRIARGIYSFIYRVFVRLKNYIYK